MPGAGGPFPLRGRVSALMFPLRGQKSEPRGLGWRMSPPPPGRTPMERTHPSKALVSNIGPPGGQGCCKKDVLSWAPGLVPPPPFQRKSVPKGETTRSLSPGALRDERFFVTLTIQHYQRSVGQRGCRWPSEGGDPPLSPPMGSYPTPLSSDSRSPPAYGIPVSAKGNERRPPHPKISV